MNKLSLKINLSQLDKTKIEVREYQNQAGETVTEKNYPCELIPLKAEKVVKVAQDYTIIKVAFIADKSTKNADGTYTNGNIIGEAIEFRKPQVASSPVKTSSFDPTTGAVNVDDIPF